MTAEPDFQSEQRALARNWVFIGFLGDIPGNNNWFRAELGGESIFVQRFDTGLRAFQNRCAHRQYPLRTSDRGTGPVICGFHHWRYNQDGIAYGIPHCQEVFGKTPKQIDARLQEIEIDTCGDLIFGRLPGDEDRPDLKSWLGEAYAILDFVGTGNPIAKSGFAADVAANWRLLMHISLDDYHIVAVHPSTFGASGYLGQDVVRYIRFGHHSAFVPTEGPDAVRSMSKACAEGAWQMTGFRIFQFFPNLIVAFIPGINIAGQQFDFVLFQHLRPLGSARTLSTTRWKLFAPGGSHQEASIVRSLLQPFVGLGFRLRMQKIHKEDNAVCENLQSNVDWSKGPGILSRQEQRIAWFEEAYSNAMKPKT